MRNRLVVGLKVKTALKAGLSEQCRDAHKEWGNIGKDMCTMCEDIEGNYEIINNSCWMIGPPPPPPVYPG